MMMRMMSFFSFHPAPRHFQEFFIISISKQQQIYKEKKKKKNLFLW